MFNVQISVPSETIKCVRDCAPLINVLNMFQLDYVAAKYWL